jgi:hypothetical protein
VLPTQAQAHPNIPAEPIGEIGRLLAWDAREQKRADEYIWPAACRYRGCPRVPSSFFVRAPIDEGAPVPRRAFTDAQGSDPPIHHGLSHNAPLPGDCVCPRA